MVNLDNLLFNGSIMIYMDKEGNVVGTALLKKRRGYVPVTIDSFHLGFIRNFKKVINRLENGDKLYCYKGEMFIGSYERRGPYGEDDVFVSIANTNGFSIIDMLFNLENKLSNNNVKSLELVRIGEFYKMSNKD